VRGRETNVLFQHSQTDFGENRGRGAKLVRFPVMGRKALLQLRILRLGLLQDGDVGVGVFPEREEFFVGGERPTVLVRIAFRFAALQVKTIMNDGMGV
jgi:hypothetical protein